MELPSLRERPGDLVAFAEHYLRHFAILCGRRVKSFTAPALAGIRAYSWPGNLRELRNSIERAVIMVKGDRIDLDDLPAELRSEPQAGANGSNTSLQVGSMVSMEQIEEAHLRSILERTSNLAEAAQVLGIDQATLYRKRKRIGLE
ncbi:Alginate biosynthesis transcriptional regulatory protein AlgB [bioreactor metagenome]|uniref:Alginate biosynthesis transcriptional regulatory protein AlgB n=1 Tax=bioreactor metagenome TaxID=1076179 RepID=A0A645IMB1_9ZZZZ